MATCGICKKEGLSRPGGLFFHGFDDWSHYRLFLCPKCLANTPLQWSGHEQCCECGEPPPEVDPDNMARIGSERFYNLQTAIQGFEQVHSDLFARMPFVSCNEDPDALHPGSTNTSFLRAWNEKYGGKGDADI